jgi:hypothetical protein
VDAGHFDTSVTGGTTAMRLALFYKFAGASESSSVNIDNQSATPAINVAGRVYSWTDVDSSNIFGGVTLKEDSANGGTLIEFSALSGLTTDMNIIRVGLMHTGTTPTDLSIVSPTADGIHALRGSPDDFSTPNQARTAAVLEYPVQTAGTDPLSANPSTYGITSSVSSGANDVGVSFALQGTTGGGPTTETLEPTSVIGTPLNLTAQGGAGSFLAAINSLTGGYLGGTDPSGISPNITFEGTADNPGNPTTATTITIPATVQNNDIIIVSVVNGDGTAQPTISDNSTVNNWTDGINGGVVKHQAGTAMAGTVFWKRITNASLEAGATVSLSGMTGSTCANLSVRRGCVTSGSPVDGTPVSESNASGNNTQAGITTLTDGAVVQLAIFYSDNTNATSGYTATSPATLTERNEITSSGGQDSGLAVAADIKATAGATGAFSWNPGTAQISVSIAYALKPASQAASTVNTNVRAAVEDPVDTMVTGSNTGVITAVLRRLGNGATDPTAVIRLRRAGINTDIAASGSLTIDQTSFTAETFSFDQSVLSGNGSDVEVFVEGTGVSGALVEVDYIKWDAQTQAASAVNASGGVARPKAIAHPGSAATVPVAATNGTPQPVARAFAGSATVTQIAAAGGNAQPKATAYAGTATVGTLVAGGNAQPVARAFAGSAATVPVSASGGTATPVMTIFPGDASAPVNVAGGTATPVASAFGGSATAPGVSASGGSVTPKVAVFAGSAAIVPVTAAGGSSTPVARVFAGAAVVDQIASAGGTARPIVQAFAGTGTFGTQVTGGNAQPVARAHPGSAATISVEAVGGTARPVETVYPGIVTTGMLAQGGTPQPVARAFGGSASAPGVSASGGTARPVASASGGSVTTGVIASGGAVSVFAVVSGGSASVPGVSALGGVASPVARVSSGMVEPTNEASGGVARPVARVFGGAADPINFAAGGVARPVAVVSPGAVVQVVQQASGGTARPVANVSAGFAAGDVTLAGIELTGVEGTYGVTEEGGYGASERDTSYTTVDF